MNWRHQDAIGLSDVNCVHCEGRGLKLLRRKGTGPRPCNCTLRGVFRACYAKFRELAEQDGEMRQAQLNTEYSGPSGSKVWGIKSREYCADFCLIARRVLDERDHAIFRFHFLLGADYNLCCRKLGMDRGNFFHAVYRIEQQLGKAYREMEPYALFPLGEYFGGVIAKALPGAYRAIQAEPIAIDEPRRKRNVSIFPKIKKAA